MIEIRLDAREYEQLIQRFEKAENLLHEVIWEELLAVAESLDKKIDSEIPVLTGRAKASWGKYQSRYVVKPGSSNESDSIWIENKNKLEVIQGSNVPYLDYLNEGHSGAAPAGFIDSASNEAEQLLEQKLAVRVNNELEKLAQRTE